MVSDCCGVHRCGLLLSRPAVVSSTVESGCWGLLWSLATAESDGSGLLWGRAAVESNCRGVGLLWSRSAVDRRRISPMWAAVGSSCAVDGCGVGLMCSRTAVESYCAVDCGSAVESGCCEVGRTIVVGALTGQPGGAWLAPWS